jgi:hypothetical protein
MFRSGTVQSAIGSLCFQINVFVLQFLCRSAPHSGESVVSRSFFLFTIRQRRYMLQVLRQAISVATALATAAPDTFLAPVLLRNVRAYRIARTLVTCQGVPTYNQQALIHRWNGRQSGCRFSLQLVDESLRFEKPRYFEILPSLILLASR